MPPGSAWTLQAPALEAGIGVTVKTETPIADTILRNQIAVAISRHPLQ